MTNELDSSLCSLVHARAGVDVRELAIAGVELDKHPEWAIAVLDFNEPTQPIPEWRPRCYIQETRSVAVQSPTARVGSLRIIAGDMTEIDSSKSTLTASGTLLLLPSSIWSILIDRLCHWCDR